ncbi:MAG TPA: valine--tRNA ligase, partial [Planctomycetota bacterium]|nr:valine--tRNA ligase [Planctomycetota bacterium]
RSFGTGAVKVTPAHDPNDFQLGERHGLEKINILNEDGTINENGGPYAGLPRFEARERIVKDLTALGLLSKVEEHVHQVGHCSRTDDVIEPYLSLQWFVKMKPLAEKAIAATTSGRVKFHPERWTDFYLQWLYNVRDWCISRQLWWGHQIPIWYGPAGEVFSGRDEAEARAQADRKLGPGAALVQDPDVLDTWFSSSLWPFSTLGWPDETADLRYYYPTSTLVTDRGIIFFWVARMVMMGEEMLGREPFSHVYINGTILDKDGRKMSKSLKNGIDPVVMIDGGVDENTGDVHKPHGADGVRYSLTTLSTEGQDLKLWAAQFEDGQRFLTKLWNAGRFALGHLSGGEASIAPAVTPEDLRFEDRWLLSRLSSAISETTACLEEFRYCDAARRVRSFVWEDFCDWYVELVKFRLTASAASADLRACRRVLAHALDVLLRLLHPVCPFITEEIWHLLGSRIKDRSLDGRGSARPGARDAAPESIMTAPWPSAEGYGESVAEAEAFALLQEVVRRIRKIRQERNVSPADSPEVILDFADRAAGRAFMAHADLLRNLARVEVVTAGTGLARPPSHAVEVLQGLEVVLPIPSADPAAERQGLQKEAEKLLAYLAREGAKLENPSFVEKAPAEVVEAARKRMDDARSRLGVLERRITELR